MGLILAEMHPAEFARRCASLVRSYAAYLASARGLTMAAAITESDRSIVARAPRGLATPGQLIRRAVADGVPVGWIWVALPGAGTPDPAWIVDVEVDPEHRSRGHAAAMIEAVAAELAGRGVPRLGLNVFGANGTAIRLYERLGFEVTAQQRSRPLSAPPAAGAGFEVSDPPAAGAGFEAGDPPAAGAGFEAGAPPKAGAGAEVRLVPIVDFAARRRELVVAHARQLIEAEGWWHGEAEERAAREIDELLPRGPGTKGAILRTVLADGVPVGWLWAGLPAPDRPGMGWLNRIDIDERHRSRGYGRAAIAAVEADLLRRGVPWLGLHVQGDNVGARRLCERLGYAVFAQQMAKDLD
jgi:mycothiol synthase